MFIVSSGRLRLSEIAVDVLPCGVVGELGLLAPNQQRTQTLECVEDAEILQIGYDRIKSIYFQNRSFGFYSLRLTSARLFQNIAQLEKELEQRGQEILRLQAANADVLTLAPVQGCAPRPRYSSLCLAWQPGQMEGLQEGRALSNGCQHWNPQAVRMSSGSPVAGSARWLMGNRLRGRLRDWCVH